MMQPGYYVVTKEALLTGIASPKHRLHRGDWLITNGISIGAFDKAENLDWHALQWVPGKPVILDEELSAQLETCSSRVAFAALETKFRALVDMGDGSPIPEMPRPSLQEALGRYLRARR
jgi:hypothetical protein